MKIFLAVSFLFITTTAAFANCSSPPGQESQTRYDFTAHKLFYCDGTNWIESGSKVGTLTNNKWCRTNGAQIICDQDAPSGAETDPQVGAVTNSKWCMGDGSAVQCNQDAPSVTESDPQVGTVTSSKWCVGAGGGVIVCNTNAPLTTLGQNSCTETNQVGNGSSLTMCPVGKYAAGMRGSVNSANMRVVCCTP